MFRRFPSGFTSYIFLIQMNKLYVRDGQTTLILKIIKFRYTSCTWYILAVIFFFHSVKYWKTFWQFVFEGERLKGTTTICFVHRENLLPKKGTLNFIIAILVNWRILILVKCAFSSCHSLLKLKNSSCHPLLNLKNSSCHPLLKLKNSSCPPLLKLINSSCHHLLKRTSSS